MVSLTLAAFLIPYAIVAVLVLLFAVVNLTHLIHYGATTATSFVVTFAYLAGIVFLGYFTWAALGGVDWSFPIVLSMPSFSQTPTL